MRFLPFNKSTSKVPKASSRTFYIKTPFRTVAFSTTVPGTLSVRMPEEYLPDGPPLASSSACATDSGNFNVDIALDKPRDMIRVAQLSTHYYPEPEPTPENLQAKNLAMGIKVRDYAYAGPVKSAVVPHGSIAATSAIARASALEGKDPYTGKFLPKRQIFRPLDPLPETFDPLFDLAKHDYILQEREREAELESALSAPPVDGSAFFPVRLDVSDNGISSRAVPMPGKVLHRLLESSTVSEEEARRRWLDIDFQAVQSYLSRPQSLYPYVTQRAAAAPSGSKAGDEPMTDHSPTSETLATPQETDDSSTGHKGPTFEQRKESLRAKEYYMRFWWGKLKEHHAMFKVVRREKGATGASLKRPISTEEGVEENIAPKKPRLA